MEPLRPVLLSKEKYSNGMTAGMLPELVNATIALHSQELFWRSMSHSAPRHSYNPHSALALVLTGLFSLNV